MNCVDLICNRVFCRTGVLEMILGDKTMRWDTLFGMLRIVYSPNMPKKVQGKSYPKEL